MDRNIRITAYYESSTIEQGTTITKFNATIGWGKNKFSRLDSTSFKELEKMIIRKVKEIVKNENNSGEN